MRKVTCKLIVVLAVMLILEAIVAFPVVAAERKALIVIDYINDFIDDRGALTCGLPGQQIDIAVRNHVNEFYKNGDLVIFACDNHEKKEYSHNPEKKLFPIHADTDWGKSIYGQTGKLYIKISGSDSVYYVPKMRYSAFFDSDVDLLLREYDIHDVYLAGVCTDICVMQTAISGYELTYNINVYKDAVASFDKNNHDWALRYMHEKLGAKII